MFEVFVFAVLSVGMFILFLSFAVFTRASRDDITLDGIVTGYSVEDYSSHVIPAVRFEYEGKTVQVHASAIMEKGKPEVGEKVRLLCEKEGDVWYVSLADYVYQGPALRILPIIFGSLSVLFAVAALYFAFVR